MAYAPAESAATFMQERTSLDGTVLCGLTYGIHLCVFSACVYFLLQNPTRERMTFVNLSFVSALFVTGTLWFAANTRVNELMFIDNRDYPASDGNPGGPYGWIIANLNNPANVLASVSFYVANILSDGLLLYRTWIFWNRNYWVIAGPAILFIADIGTGAFTCYYNSKPPTSFVLYALPFFCVSNLLNVLLPALIVGRLISQARRMNKALGQRHGHVYTSVASIVIESAMPYSVCAIIYTITFALNSPINNIALPMLGQIMCISPELIILRVALGRSGWNASAKPLFGAGAVTRPTSIAIATQRSMRWQVSPADSATSGTPLNTFTITSPSSEKGMPRGLPSPIDYDGKSMLAV